MVSVRFSLGQFNIVFGYFVFPPRTLCFGSSGFELASNVLTGTLNPTYSFVALSMVRICTCFADTLIVTLTTGAANAKFLLLLDLQETFPSPRCRIVPNFLLLCQKTV